MAKTWQRLHAYHDRREVPPPAILPILIEADFEDASLWSQMARPCLGLKPFEALDRMAEGRPITEVKHEGSLPPVMQRGLEEVFGCAFTDFGMLDCMTSDPILSEEEGDE